MVLRLEDHLNDLKEVFKVNFQILWHEQPGKFPKMFHEFNWDTVVQYSVPSGKYKKKASLMVCILAICFCKICCTLLVIVQSRDPAIQIKCKAAIDWQQHLNNGAAIYSVFIWFVPSLFIHQWCSRHWLILFSVRSTIVGIQGRYGSIQNS